MTGLLSYYTSISFIIWISLIIMCVLVHDNGRLSKENKLAYYLTYGFIFVASLAEWAGVNMNGNENFPDGLIIFAKCSVLRKMSSFYSAEEKLGS